MDIRIIDEKNRRVVNVSRLSLEVRGNTVVGITDEGKLVNVRGCYDEQEAGRLMDRIMERIEDAYQGEWRDLIIKL